MALRIIQWTDEIVDHIAQHGITVEDFEGVLADPDVLTTSKSSGLPAAIGTTADGRVIFCVYEQFDDVYFVPVTAFELED